MTNKLKVISPLTGKLITELDVDTEQTLNIKIDKAIIIQNDFKKEPRKFREDLLLSFAEALDTNEAELTNIIIDDAGKSKVESRNEVAGAINTIRNTIAQATLSNVDGMQRLKERQPVGVVGLITSFNFPLAVAFWTIAPAILSGNAVIWKPSKTTPLITIRIKEIFDSVVDGKYKDLLQVLISERGLGSKLVSHEHIDMISATGSVEMGESITKTLYRKINNATRPILELGGNNGVIISEKMSTAHLSFSLDAIMNSFLGSNGQRCTNTRRLIVHRSQYDFVKNMLEIKVNNMLKQDIVESIRTKSWNEYGYSALIDNQAFIRFLSATCAATIQGGNVRFGNRLLTEDTVYVVEPALAFMKHQTDIMFKECFGPLLFVVPYDTIEEAVDILNAPSNAGLVSGIYTQNQEEVDLFISKAESGHILVNSPKGTGTPAYGMGFGGNKDSGEGEILNTIDPLLPFTKQGKYSRIAINEYITMDK